MRLKPSDKLEKVPLGTDEHGVLYVGGTRVTLDCVIDMFEQGASPEAIVDEYDVLKLDDVYSLITYYLRNREEVRAYLSKQERKAEASREKLEREQKPNPLRDRLLKLKSERGSTSP